MSHQWALSHTNYMTNKKNNSVNCFFVASNVIYDATTTRDTMSLTIKSHDNTLKTLGVRMTWFDLIC